MKTTIPAAAQTENEDAVQGEGDYKSAETYGKSVRPRALARTSTDKP